MCSAFIAQHLSWRWVFYVQVIDYGLLILAVAIFFKETRGSVLLSRRANVLNSWYKAREKVGLVGLEMLLGESVASPSGKSVDSPSIMAPAAVDDNPRASLLTRLDHSSCRRGRQASGESDDSPSFFPTFSLLQSPPTFSPNLLEHPCPSFKYSFFCPFLYPNTWQCPNRRLSRAASATTTHRTRNSRRQKSQRQRGLG